ncbi:alpha-protein kinase 1-like [Microplitis mediator]|uniref:alpha-protein kinase 1-like n=1 Tax=Microplitis mediator TaxID=375433 RepID=UPI0025525AFC|nr:alpha-protein kinase 1-like [Microplitis mediator]XP_057328101.1 alpha-protein kinase 1-like [Microplitis mediator]
MDTSEEEPEDSLTMLARKKRMFKRQLEANVQQEMVNDIIMAHQMTRQEKNKVSENLSLSNSGDEIESGASKDNNIPMSDGAMEPLASPNFESTEKEVITLVLETENQRPKTPAIREEVVITPVLEIENQQPKTPAIREDEAIESTSGTQRKFPPAVTIKDSRAVEPDGQSCNLNTLLKQNTLLMAQIKKLKMQNQQLQIGIAHNQQQQQEQPPQQQQAQQQQPQQQQHHQQQQPQQQPQQQQQQQQRQQQLHYLNYPPAVPLQNVNPVRIFPDGRFHVGDDLYIFSSAYENATNANNPSKFITTMAYAVWGYENLATKTVRMQANTKPDKSELTPRKKELITQHFKKYLKEKNFHEQKIFYELKNVNTYFGRAITGAEKKIKNRQAGNN